MWDSEAFSSHSQWSLLHKATKTPCELPLFYCQLTQNIISYFLLHTLNTASGVLNDPLRWNNSSGFTLTRRFWVGKLAANNPRLDHSRCVANSYVCFTVHSSVFITIKCFFFFCLSFVHWVCLWEVPVTGNQELSGGLVPRQTVCVRSVPG